MYLTKNSKDGGSKFTKRLKVPFVMSLSLMVIFSGKFFSPAEDYRVHQQRSGVYAHENFLLEECKRKSREAHNQRLGDIEAREDMLGVMPIATGFVFGGLAAIAGYFTAGTATYPIATLGTVEVAWMYSQIKEQASEARIRSSNQWSADDIQCERDLETLASELENADQAEAQVHFDFMSGSILGGLVDLPNGRKTRTSATHVNY